MKPLVKLSLRACGLAVIAVAVSPVLKLCAQSTAVQPPLTSWVNWTADVVANPAGTVTGTMGVGDGYVNVTYSGEVFGQTELMGSGIDYYTPIATYTNAIVPNAPFSGMVTVTGGGAVDTVTFSPAVTNPVMAMVSEGSSGNDVDFSFNSPFTILSSGPGYWGSGPPLTQTGNVLHGAESDGVIQFTGVLGSISWTVSAGDSYYSGFTFGATNSLLPGISSATPGNIVLFQGESVSFTAAGTGAGPLTYQWSVNGTAVVNQNRLFGAQSNILTFTNALVSDSGTYQLTVTNALGMAASNITVLVVLPDDSYDVFNAYGTAITNTSGLLGYWRFDPVFQMNSCVNGYTGAPQGNAQIGLPGSGCPLFGDPENQSLLLDGNGSYLVTSLTGQITNQGTLMAWVYLTTEPSTAGRIFSVVNQSDNGNDFDLQIETDNILRFYAGVTVSSQALPLNQWHFLAATLNTNSSADIFLDGQLIASGTGGSHNVDNNPVTIGESDVFQGRFFQGQLDEVAIFNRALSPAEIAAFYSVALGSPTLSVALSQSSVVVTWPTNFMGYMLQTNVSLNSTNWGTVPLPYNINSNQYFVTGPPAGTQVFYRLKN